jgi:NAD+ kinase
MDRGGHGVSKNRKIRSVALVAKPNRRARPFLEDLLKRLRNRKVKVVLDREAAALLGRKRALDRDTIAKEVDLVIVLGGDGTLLSVARGAVRAETPILGINLGGLGFLTDLSTGDAKESLDRVLAGEFEIDRRMMLAVEVQRDGRPPTRHRVLNDAVINNGALARIMDVELRVDGQQITVYRADGLILTTPTGSTAYGLAAGGPILHPRLQAIGVIPICPHTLTNRPLIVPGEMVLEARVLATSENVLLTLDGQVGFPLTTADRLRARRSSRSLRLVTLPGRNYFQVLRHKLKWGTR